MFGSWSRLTAIVGVALCVGLVSLDTADAQRRGGGFGSRGARTYRPPPPTRTAPQPAAPVQRSMTQPAPGQPGAQPGGQPGQARPAAPTAAGAQAQPPRRGGFLGGLGGGLLGGLLAGGLIGALMGNGFGAGMAGFGSMLLQIAVIGGLVMLVMAFLRRRRQPVAEAGPQGWQANPFQREASPQAPIYPDFGGGAARAAPSTYVPVTAPAPQSDFAAGEEIGVTGGDRETFERLLMEVQDGFGREDYAALRERTTPEVMGYLAETLAANATSGKRNEIVGTRLLEADVAEAWREGDRDYATTAMRFEAINVMRDRATGAVLEGDPAQPLQTTELWTFVRQGGGAWKLSAIQEVQG